MNEPKNMENKLNSHRAGADQWAMIEKWAKDCTYESCLIDLRDRLEALERKVFWYRPKQSSVQREIADAEAFGLTSTSGSLVDRSAPAPASSLVERVMIAGGMGLTESARAAIREVAVAARSRGDQPFTWEHVAQWLEQEADRD